MEITKLNKYKESNMKRYFILLGALMLLSISSFAQVNVTFNVDMSVYWKGNSFNPATDTVRIAGDFNGWSTTANDLTKGTGADSAVYSAQISSVTAGSHSYKFIFIKSGSINWENDPNRSATIGTNDTTLATVQFNNITGKQNNVWFKVDMGREISLGNLNPSTDTVAVTGDFTGWGTRTNSLFLTKGATDSIYSGLADSIASGRTVNFKFIYLDGNINWENDPNRTYFIPEQDSSTFSAFWNNVDPNIQTGSGNILFQIDMSVMDEVGVFNPAADSVQVRGDFNGWSDTEPARSKMNQDITDPNYWYLQVPFTNAVVNTKSYKYFVDTAVTSIWTDPWERPGYTGGGNRSILFEASPTQEASLVYYDDIHPDWVIEDGKNLSVTFRVYMQPATTRPVPFDPGTDTLYWICEMPSFVRTQGWIDTDELRVLRLTDDNSDMIYEGTGLIQDPSFNAFEYRYGWVDVAGGSWQREDPAGAGQDAYRLRFIGQDAPRSFPTNPWIMPIDTINWTAPKVKESDPYSSLGIKDKGIVALTYSLEQNYPNPFNPATLIRFSIPEPGLVTMKIFNLIGEEVATILNKELKSGTYEVDFNASNLSSGVYFYTVTANNYVATKKMLLLK